MSEYSDQTYKDRNYTGQAKEEKSSEEIRADIERTRNNMTEKIDTIQDRLSPDNLKVQAQSMVQDIVQESTDAIMEFVRSGSRQAGSTLVETIKQNPLPSAVVGLGLGWLLMNMMNSQGSSDRDRDYRDRDNRNLNYGAGYAPNYGARVPIAGQYGYEEWQGSAAAYETAQYDRSQGSGIGDAAGKVGHTAQNVAGKVGDTAQDVAGKVGDTAQNVAGKVGEVAHNLAGSVTGAVQDAAGKVGETAHDLSQRLGEGAGAVASTTSSAGQQAMHASRSAAQQATRQAGSLTSQGQYQAGRVGRTVQRSLEDNPIAFGIAALIAGAAIGLALPATRQERQLLGDVHDQVMDKAQSFASDLAEEAKDVVAEVKPRLEETAQKVTQDLKESGKLIGDEIKQTGKQAGQEVKQTLEDAGSKVRSKVDAKVEGVDSTAKDNDSQVASSSTGSSFSNKADKI